MYDDINWEYEGELYGYWITRSMTNEFDMHTKWLYFGVIAGGLFGRAYRVITRLFHEFMYFRISETNERSCGNWKLDDSSLHLFNSSVALVYLESMELLPLPRRS